MVVLMRCKELPLKGFPELKRRQLIKLGRKCLSKQNSILGNIQTDQNRGRGWRRAPGKKLYRSVARAPSLESDLSSSPCFGAL